MMLWLSLLSSLTLLGYTSACVIDLQDPSLTTAKDRLYRDITTNCGPDDIPPVTRVNTTAQLADLREEMINSNLQAYIVPIDEENRLAWVSGFSGSAGVAVITLDEASLWTDGRYFLQASEQLDCNWYLMRMGEDGVPILEDWIAQALLNQTVQDKRVGADPKLVGTGDWLDWQESLEKNGIDMLKSINLIDLIWTEEQGRPPKVYKDIVIHDLNWAGESWEAKIGRLREKLVEEQVYGMIVSELDEVAWLLNLRGEGSSSLEGLFHSPLFETLALVTMQEVRLWVHLEKVTSEITEHLNQPNCMESNICVIISEVEKSLADLEEWFSTQSDDKKILVTDASTYLSGANFAVYSTVPEQTRFLLESPVLSMKSIKNKVEEEGMMNAHVKDAVALIGWAAMIEQQIQMGVNWTEISAAELLSEYRLEQQDSKGDSFGTIAGFGSNGAVIHYSSTPQTNRVIDSSSLFLVDSGGQYLDGTTDVTRTFHYGTPTAEQIARYTDVLRGAIQLASVQAPEGTLDTSVDYATRQFLYRHGLEYRHGTGHGIGAYLKVHEGPTRIAMKRDKPAGLKPGIFFSDEPGYYKEGEFGIRLETILKVVPKEDVEDQGYGSFIKFDPVSLVPFEPKLIDYAALDHQEIDWLNDYNEIIKQKIVPRFEESGDEAALAWIASRTNNIKQTK